MYHGKSHRREYDHKSLGEYLACLGYEDMPEYGFFYYRTQYSQGYDHQYGIDRLRSSGDIALVHGRSLFCIKKSVGDDKDIVYYHGQYEHSDYDKDVLYRVSLPHGARLLKIILTDDKTCYSHEYVHYYLEVLQMHDLG